MKKKERKRKKILKKSDEFQILLNIWDWRGKNPCQIKSVMSSKASLLPVLGFNKFKT